MGLARGYLREHVDAPLPIANSIEGEPEVQNRLRNLFGHINAFYRLLLRLFCGPGGRKKFLGEAYALFEVIDSQIVLR